MEDAELRDSLWWSDNSLQIVRNPSNPLKIGELETFLFENNQQGIVIPTSGSEGESPKFVVLSKDALLASARAVNRHFGASKHDRWLCALPTFHVGGLGVYARAFVAGGLVFSAGDRWNPKRYRDICSKEKITQSSLTPTQVYDLVRENIPCPRSLRSIVVGGGAIDRQLLKDGIALGWPLLRSYGMTEASSQLATELSPGSSDAWLPILDGWETRVEPESNCLQFRGSAACSGWAKNENGTWKWHTPEGGWITTRDIVELSTCGTRLRFVSRADDQIKILGELVSLQSIRNKFPHGTIVAIEHSRRGFELIAFLETTDPEWASERLEEYNSSVPGFEQIAQFKLVDQLPRTALGKIAFGKLRAMASS